MSKDVTRLFKQFQPTHYDLDILPDRDAMKFSGSVTIAGRKTGRPSQRLTFHQNGLKITHAEVVKKDKKGDRPIVIDRINHHSSYDEVRLHASEMLYPGEYTVRLQFKGDITRPMNGIYPCFFTHDKHDKQLVATQFESHHAREAFPCIDEPEAKATFQLTLTTPVGETVLSNTPIAHEETTKKKLGTKKTTFEVTPKMSTYLLAFVYGDMGFKEAKTKDGTVVRAYATPDNVQFTDFALDVGVKVLEFYNEYFDIPYPLPKYDMVALPDFAAGAMENWGCVTFREQCLLVDPKNTSLPTKQYVAMVVAHELTHQWFGNLVTMRWWTDLWLNEGFASWIEYLAVDRLFPEWNMWTQFIVDEQQPALRLDALENTHPVEVPVHHPDEIRTIFDTISYNKGASVIHMLHEYLGATAFRDGLRHYLKTHTYGNTDTVDLWSSLEHVSKKPVKDFMHAWTSRPGFPIVQATFSSKNKGETQLALHQERFTFDAQARKNGTSPKWPIPLNGTGVLHDTVLKTAKQTINLGGGEADTYWLNTGHGGFYHTVYDSAYVQKLGLAVRAGKLDPLDRLGILSDMLEAAKAGYTSSVDVLNLLSAYADEDNALVWDIVAAVVGGTRGVMDDEELRELMKPFTRKLVAKQLKRLGWESKKGEPHFDSLLRPTILGLASVAGEESVVKECLTRFKAMNKPEDLAPDLRNVIYNTAAREGDVNAYEKLLKLHNNTQSSDERTTLAAALTGFKQPELIKRTLGLIDTDTVRLQDIGYWIAYSFMNRYSKQATWEWMTEHWQWLNDNLGSDLSFHRFPVYAARCFSDTDFLPAYKKFFTANMTTALKRPYKQGIEIIEWQSAWKARDLEAIKQFFKAS